MVCIECRQIKVKKSDKAAIEREVEAACKEMLVRSGGKGFPLLFDRPVSASSVVAAVQRVVGASALLYTEDGSEKNEATEAEVEVWLSRWKRGEEKRVLLTDQDISRGWESYLDRVQRDRKPGDENLWLLHSHQNRIVCLNILTLSFI